MSLSSDRSSLTVIDEPSQLESEIKTIHISVGHGVIKQVSINKNSGLLWSLHQDVSHDIPYNLTQYLTTSSQWSSSIDETSVTIYVYFLLGNEAVIIDRDIMTSCFLIYSLLEDTNFFKFLMDQMLQRWTLLSQILYNTDDYSLPDDTKDDIFLLCPQMLLPKKYINDKIFMDSWMVKHNKQIITLNNVEKFEVTCTVTTETDNDYRLDNDDDYDDDYDNNDDNIIVHQEIYDSIYTQPIEIINPTSSDTDDIYDGNENVVNYMSVTKKTYTLDNIFIESASDQKKTYNHLVQGKNLYTYWVSKKDEKRTRMSTYINNLLFGPQIQYLNDEIFEDKYDEYSHSIGDIKVYGKGGQLLEYTRISLDGNSRTYEYYSDSGNLDYIRQSNKDNDDYWQIVYSNKYLEDGSYVESNQQEANYYDTHHQLVRKITLPYSSSGDKYDITYDEYGNQDIITKLPSNIQVDLSSGTYPYTFKINNAYRIYS